TTASEQNNDHFEVERSLDGASFVKIGRVAGHGTTSTNSAYTFTDAGIGAKVSGAVYYRLRQVDLGGTATYSPVRTASFSPSATLSLSLYPNPAATYTSLDLSLLPATATVQVQLLDATGRAVRSWTLAGGQVQPLGVSELAHGSYLLLVTGTRPDGSLLKQTLRLTKE
ncbi:MAG: T9SS type A sorting domain-containing protein, partial [Hymenobacter sp.]